MTSATFTTTVSEPLPVGIDQITASYEGNSNFKPSETSAPTSETVEKATTATKLETSNATTSYGQPVTFTATITGPAGVLPPPSGEVKFFDGATEIGKSTVSTSAGVTTATFTTTVSAPLPVGKDPITVSYEGDGNYKPSQTATATQETVEKASTSVSLETSNATTSYGQPVKFTATVTGPAGVLPAPSGEVKFFDGATEIGKSTVSTSAGVTTATFTTTVSAPLPVGKDPITVSYEGDGNYKPSQTATATQETVEKASTSVSLETSNATTSYGQPVKFTATVTGPAGVLPAPSGEVKFFDGATEIGKSTVSTSAGVTTATFTTTVSAPLPVGKDPITVSYEGDGNYKPSQTATATQETVEKASTSVSLETSNATTSYGQPVKFTATVTGPAGVLPAPSGEVKFFDGATEIGKSTVSTSAGVTTATFTTTVSAPLPVGKDPITVSYEGDGNYKPSQTATATQETVEKASTSVSLETSNATTSYGQPVKFTATVTGPAGVLPAPSGEVKFFEGASEISKSTVSTAGGVTSATLTTSSLTTGLHKITAQYAGDSNYNTSGSGTVEINVLAKPSVTKQPVSKTVTAGEGASFTAEASGNPVPTVQWDVSEGGGAFKAVSGATSDTLSIASTSVSESGNKYEAVFTNSQGEATSNPATLTVNAAPCSASPSVETQPANQTVTAPAAATFTVKEGTVPANCSAATVQWQVSTNKGSTWGNVSGAISATLQINPTSTTESGNEYRAVLTNAHGATNSNPATLTVNAPACSAAPSITEQPESQTVTAPGTATFKAAGSTPANCSAPSVQWYSEAPGASSFSSIGGATSASYTTPPTTTAQSGTKYEAVFTNSLGEKTTNVATLTVNAAPCSASPSVETQPANQTVTAPAAATFTVKEGAVPANCSAATVQWQVSTNKGSTWGNVSGAISATLQINPTSTTESGNEYRAVLTNAHGATNSNPATLTVNAPLAKPSVTKQPVSKTVTAGEGASFTAEASGNPVPTVQWDVSEGGGAFKAVSGATSDTLSIASTSVSESGNKYEAVFTNSQGEATSNPATLTVSPVTPPCHEVPSITLQPVSRTVVAPATAVFSAGGSTPSGCSAPSVQWYSEAPGAHSFSAIAGASSASYTTPATTTAMSGTRYEAVFTNSFGERTTNVATLTVNAPPCAASPAIETQPTSQTVTAPNEASFKVKEGKVPANCSAASIQWQLSTNKGASWSNISGASSATLQIKPTNTTESGHEFRAVLTNAHGATNSNAATLTVNRSLCHEVPSITLQPVSRTVVAPATAVFSAGGSTPSGCSAPSVQWYSEAPGAHSFSAIAGASSVSYTTPATTTAMSGTRYEAVFTNSFGERTTNVATLTVNLPPGTPTVGLLFPSRGPAGSIILIFGTNFNGVTAVDFGSTSARFDVLVPQIMIVQVPAGVSGTVDVTVHTATLTSPITQADKFTVSSGGFGGF